jgi:hypothetical protein
VSGDLFGVEPGSFGSTCDDDGNSAVGETFGSNMTVRVDRSEQGTVFDAGVFKPCSEGSDGDAAVIPLHRPCVVGLRNKR